MDHQELKNLLDRYLTGELSAEERVRLAKTVGEEEYQAMLEQFVQETLLDDDFRVDPAPGVQETILAKLEEELAKGRRRDRTGRTRRIPPFIRYAAAAVVILVVAGLAYFWNPKTPVAAPTALNGPVPANDVAPGHYGAILTLGDGKKIVLDSTRNGEVATQGGAAIRQQQAGQLVYAPAAAPAEILYNTLTTPKARKISVVLSDGTKVWLNAASTIRFPAVFAGNIRTVELTGEAYFEVAKAAGRPFIVKVSKQDLGIQVLGTSFDVMAYGDEPNVHTSLVDGAVRVVTARASTQLAPGQQLITGDDGRQRLVADADIQKAIAWKDGNFMFHEDGLEDIMRQLARWYDIDVHFDMIGNDHYTGKISRQANISQVLKMLEAAGGVSFSVRDKEVKVLHKTM